MGLQAWEYPCGPLWLNISGHVFSFSILWPILHLWNAKPGNNTGRIGNFEIIIGSFCGIKEQNKIE